MKVCFVFGSYGIGGAERSMLRLIRYCHPRLMECSVLVVGLHNELLKAAAHSLGIDYEDVCNGDYARFVGFFKTRKSDVVYLFGRLRTLLWAVAARRAGVRCIIGAERSSAATTTDWISRRIDSFFVDGYITNSMCAAGNLSQRIGIWPDRVFTVFNGIDEDAPPGEAPPGGDPGKPSILCVANIIPLKGHIQLLRAAQRLKERYPDIRVVLAGNDFMRGRLFEQARKEGLEGLYTWLGFVNDVRGYLARADVFVLPSLVREGMPTTILEAMQAGLPVVASRVGGTEELVEDGVTGFLVPPSDPVALADRIRRVLEDPALARSMGDNARSHVQKNHSMQSMAEGHLNVFRTLMNRRPL